MYLSKHVNMCKRIHVSILTYKQVNINMYTSYPPLRFGTEGGNIWKRSNIYTWRISAHVYRWSCDSVNQCVYMGVCVCEHAISCVHAIWTHGTMIEWTREHTSRTCVYRRTGEQWVIKCICDHVTSDQCVTYVVVYTGTYEHMSLETCDHMNRCATWACGHVTYERVDT